MYVDGWQPLFFLGTVGTIIAIAIVLYILIVAVLRATVGPPRPTEDTALRILRERFARGEIGEEEYQKACRTLEK